MAGGGSVEFSTVSSNSDLSEHSVCIPNYEFLKCSLGEEHLLKSPYLLRCLHAYCKACLPAIAVSDNTGYLCSSCNCVTESGRIKSSLLLNVLVQRYEVDRCSFQCSTCGEKNIVKYCKQCDTSFCDICMTKHPADHVLSIPEAISNVISRKADVDLACREHQGKHKDLYCQQCSQILCTVCQETSHCDHRVIPAAEKVVELLSSFDQAQFEVRKKWQRQNFKIARVEHARVAFNKTADEEIAKLKNYRNLLVQQINQAFENILDDAKAKRRYADTYYTNTVKEVQRVQQALEHKLAWVELIKEQDKTAFLLKTLQHELEPLNQMESEDISNDKDPLTNRHSVIALTAKISKLPDVRDFTSLLQSTFNIFSGSWQFQALSSKISLTLDAVMDPVADECVLNLKSSANLVQSWTYLVDSGQTCHSLAPCDTHLLLLQSNALQQLALDGRADDNIPLPLAVGKPRAMDTLSKHTFLLTADNGLFTLNINDVDKVQLLQDGRFGYGLYIWGNQAVAISLSENQVYWLKFHVCTGIVMKRKTALLYQCSLNDTVAMRDEYLYVCSWQNNKFYQYNQTGTLLTTIDTYHSCKLGSPCIARSHDRVVLHSRDQKALFVLLDDNQWRKVDLEFENVKQLMSVTIKKDKIYLISSHFGECMVMQLNAATE